MTDFPIASEIESKTAPDMDALLATLKYLEVQDLFKVMKQAISEAEKRSKGAPKPASKKVGSMPKGKVPPQLMKPRAWVEFTLKHALENGWEAFTVHQTKKDKETGEKTTEEILQPGSILHEGAHVYEDSVTEKTPNGKQLIHKDAMSLSKQRWAPKESSGTHQELYEEFLTTYVEDTVSESSEPAKVVVKMTAAEKTALAEEKKAEKEREKEEKKAEKLRLAEEKKAEKLREKEEKQAAKPTKAPKVATPVKVPVKVVKAPVKAVVKAPEAAKTPDKVQDKVPVKAKVQVKKPEWTCPADDMVHPWPYKGKNYLRNFQNEVWTKGTDGACGEWQGIYLPAEDRIDETAEEPVFEE